MARKTNRFKLLMSNNNSHRNHHFVPRFLLAEWAGKDGKLGVFRRLPSGAVRFDRHSPKAVAKLEHLYSIRRGSSQPDVFIEKNILGPHVDDIAAPVHQHILSHGVINLSDDQRFIWSRLLLAGMFRVPFMIDHFRNMGRERVRAKNGEAAASHVNALDEGLKLFVASIGSQKYNVKIRSAEWMVVKVPSGRKDALICDLPLAYFGDFFKDAFALVMPISPRQFFICASGEYIEKFAHMNHARMTKATNTRLVQHADQYVYTTDLRHQGLVEKWLRSYSLAS